MPKYPDANLRVIWLRSFIEIEIGIGIGIGIEIGQSSDCLGKRLLTQISGQGERQTH